VALEVGAGVHAHQTHVNRLNDRALGAVGEVCRRANVGVRILTVAADRAGARRVRRGAAAGGGLGTGGGPEERDSLVVGVVLEIQTADVLGDRSSNGADVDGADAVAVSIRQGDAIQRVWRIVVRGVDALDGDQRLIARRVRPDRGRADVGREYRARSV